MKPIFSVTYSCFLRQFRLTSMCIPLGLVLLLGSWLHAATPRNLLLIQTDEHHFNTLGCYGGKIVKTPHIDWIANHGAICTSFYATTPVCSPSRAALVSGLYPQKTPVTQNNIPLSDNIVTFAELLKRNGYATGYAGKWHLDGDGKPQWAPQRQFGFTDNRFMFNRGHWKKFEDTSSGPRVGSRNAKGVPDYRINGANESTFSTDWLCGKAIDFINENHDKPFCYMVSLPDPHGPNTVRAPYDTMYANIEVPLPVTLKRTEDQIPNWGKPDNVRPAQLRKLMRTYYGMVKCIDDNVGKILDSLRERGILEQTTIVFTSDHGDLCGEHGRLNKGVPYEGSARIPFLIFCSEKIPEKTVVPQALGCVDFLPTIMTLLDVQLPHQVDGRDASKLLAGDATDWDDAAFIRSTSSRTPWLAVVTETHKLVYSVADTPWLLDLRTDPQEVTNLFDDPKLKSLVRTLTQKLHAYAQQHNDPFIRRPEIKKQVELVLRRQ